jgi:AcrR family transcriptional regulator
MPQRTPKKKAPRRAPLSRERVLLAALTMADEHGIDSLSMRNLAAALKVEAMSLYNHVSSKESILEGLVELVVSEIELPERDDADWRATMRTRALSAHAVLMRHPWATQLFASRVNVGPNMLHYVDRTIGCLRRAGFSYALADHAWNALDAYIYGFTFHKLNFPLEPSQYASAAAGFIHLIPPEEFPHLNGMSQEVIAGRHDGLHHIELGLDLLLDGLERLRAEREPSGDGGHRASRSAGSRR